MKRCSPTQTILFFLLCTLLCLGYNYHQILFEKLYSIHYWRQADCLSLTQNYCKESLNFFTPEVHWVGNKGHGKTISEFPIIYFTVGQLWKIFGEQEFIFRLINFLFVLMGLFSLHRLSYNILQDSFWGMFVPLFLFTSPLLIYYANNFLSNASAFGLALTGSYFYYNFHVSRVRKWLYFSMLVFALAGLLKITSLMIFLAILFVIVLTSLPSLKDKKAITAVLRKIFPFVVVLLVLAIWYVYASYYNRHNHRHIFLQQIFPIWELTAEKRAETARLLYFNLLPSYFNKKVLLFIALIFLSLFFLMRKTNKSLHRVLIVTFIGILCYGVLWFRALHVHDYYLTNLLIFIPLTLLVLFDVLRNNYFNLFKSKVLKGVFLLVFLYLAIQGALINRMKYQPINDSAINKLFVKKKDIDFWNYYHWDYKNQKSAFESVTPLLRSLGIQRTDKVLSMSDYSINITLYQMDQKGLTQYGFSHFSNNERINFAIEQGCRYMIISEKDLKRLEINNTYLQQKIAQHKNLLIYKLS